MEVFIREINFYLLLLQSAEQKNLFDDVRSAGKDMNSEILEHEKLHTD